MSVNKVIIVGNLGRDPESRATGTGSTVCNLRIATTERQKDRDGNWTDHTEWHAVVVFGKTAENVVKYCQKGKQLYVEGRLRTRKWTDKDGVEKYSTEVVADVVHFLSGGGREAEREEAAPAPKRSAEPKGAKHTKRDASNTASPDDDIPF